MEEIINKIKSNNILIGVAGPGAGKTYTFKKIIESKEYSGKKILVLSFINKLIDDLTNELSCYNNVEVRTLHSFANKYLGNVQMISFLDNLIKEDYNYIYNKDFDFEEKLYLNELSKNTNEFSFYRDRKSFYEQKKERIYSFNSAILAVNIKFESKKDTIPQYDLILIDEFQDFNLLEFHLIKLLNLKTKIVIVGDDDQSLYSFKQAKPSIIRELFNDNSKEKFSLDYCRRCTEIIVKASNNLLKESIRLGLLKGRIDKKFLYPVGDNKSKDELSNKINKIDFIPKLQGQQLIYHLTKKILNDIKDSSSQKQKRILILAPKHYHKTLYDGLVKNNFIVLDYELFSYEQKNEMSHLSLIQAFNILSKTKTDNLYLRLILNLYLNKEDISNILKQNKKIWSCLDNKVKKMIEADISLFKKAKNGTKDFTDLEIVRLNRIFNLKNLINKMLNGFDKVKPNAINVEIVTPMSSKGLSADLVYYVYIDDDILFGKEKNKTDNKICEFFVGITRAKERLTLISKNEENPSILKLLGMSNINKIEIIN